MGSMGSRTRFGHSCHCGLVELAIFRQCRIFDHADARAQGKGQACTRMRNRSAGITEELHARGSMPAATISVQPCSGSSG